MVKVLHTVIETPDFLSDAKRSGLTLAERQEMVDFIAENPTAGDVIQGTGGARKLRFAGKGKGKSGAYRVITFYAAADVPVFLLNVFAKNERMNISQSERNEMKAILGKVADAYRKGAQRNVKGR